MNKRIRFFNFIVLFVVVIIIAAAILLRNQTVSYNLVGSTDSSVTLSPGDIFIQTYYPNRKEIVEVDFVLKEDTLLDGEYSLVISEGGYPFEGYGSKVTNLYNGENESVLRFKLSGKYKPSPGARLNLFIMSGEKNKDKIELASDSSYRSFFVYDIPTAVHKQGDYTLDVRILAEKNYKWFLLMCVLLFTVGITLLMVHFFKNSFEENVALSVFVTVFLSYMFGLMGALKLVFVILFIASIAGIVFFFLDCNKRELPFYKCVDNGAILWAVTVLVLFVTIRHTYIGDPDTIFYMNNCKYMFWSDSLAYTHGYHQFISVFAYLFEAINGIFSEDIYLFSIILYEFSLLFVFLNVIRLQGKKQDFMFKVLLLALCTIFAVAVLPSAFFSAMMDVPFAITLAYVLGNLYFEKLSKISLIRIICASIALVMIKRAGLPAVLIIALLLATHAVRFREKGRKFEKKYLAAMLLLLFACITASKTVDILGARLTDKVPIEWEVDYSYVASGSEQQENPQYLIASSAPYLPALVSLTDQSGSIDVAILRKLADAFFNMKTFMGLSYAEALGIVFIIAAVLWLVRRDETSLEFFKDSLEVVFAALLYFSSLIYKYLYNMEEYNRGSLNAYDRYAVHFVGALAIFEAVYLIKVLHQESNGKDNMLRLVVITLVVMVASCIRIDFASMTSWIDSDIVSIEKSRDDFERALSIYYGYGHRMAVYMPEKSFDQASYYVKRIDLECWTSIASLCTDSITSEDMLMDYARYLSNREYLYLVNYDADFLKYCSRLFDNNGQDIKRHALYHIKLKENGALYLEYLGQIPFSDSVLRTLDGTDRIEG